MDFYSAIILNPYNYYELNSNIGILLHSKGLYKFYMDLENEPNVVVEKAKCHNIMDEAYGLVCLSIYHHLLFHIDGLTTPNQVWTKLESLFGVQDEIRAHQLENALFSLSPGSFESIEDYPPNSSQLFYLSSNMGLRRRNINLSFPSYQNWVLNTRAYFSCY